MEAPRPGLLGGDVEGGETEGLLVGEAVGEAVGEGEGDLEKTVLGLSRVGETEGPNCSSTLELALFIDASEGKRFLPRRGMGFNRRPECTFFFFFFFFFLFRKKKKINFKKNLRCGVKNYKGFAFVCPVVAVVKWLEGHGEYIYIYIYVYRYIYIYKYRIFIKQLLRNLFFYLRLHFFQMPLY